MSLRRHLPVLFRRVVLAVLACAFAVPAWAHVGSPDIFVEGLAGPYKVFVTIRPPAVIPGVARVEVRTSDPRIGRIEIAPMPLVGEASKHPPIADLLKRSAEDPEFYSGSLWIMASGSWQVRLTASGSAGSGALSVPVAATPTTTLRMQPMLGAALLLLGTLLVLGMAGIAAAAVREAQLAPGAPVPAARRKRSWIAMGIALAVLLVAVWLGGKWWNTEAAGYANNIYKPLEMRATLGPGNLLDLTLSDPVSGAAGWISRRKVDDFIPDHDHLMHLYMIREPQMDVVFHLHPSYAQANEFRLELPSMPAGNYRLYADVVHADGFPETMVSTVSVPAISGRALSGDDAQAMPLPLSQAKDNETSFRLPDGYLMAWARPGVLKAGRSQIFEFYLLDPQGKPPGDMALYMGMLGHAAFVRTDGGVFAHIHPSGSASMAAMMLAQQSVTPAAGSKAGNDSMPGMIMDSASGSTSANGDAVTGSLPNHVGFPYGFPSPGKYRIFVQMKHGSTIETGCFDADIQP